MRLAQYIDGGQKGVAVVRTDGELAFTGYSEMIEFIRDGDRAKERAEQALQSDSTVTYDKLIAPLDNPGKILASGPNYTSHGEENPDWVPASEPRWDFVKLTSSITGPYDDIVIPPNDDVIRRLPGGVERFSEFGFAVDWEVELAVIIGRTCKNVRRDDWESHVFGYTVINDVGARSVQFHNDQRFLGKGFDTFCPMGPYIVTADEISDLGTVRLASYVNNEICQEALVAEQLNPPSTSIEWISSVIRLDPGDILCTGTPAGVGIFRDPPRFLTPGDLVKCEASGIGHIENRVVQGANRTYPTS